jgi:histone H3/H4
MAESENPENPETEGDILIVVSKLKKYIKALSGMNTSDKVAGVLSEHLREMCREAVRRATADGRRTVLERDFAQKTDAGA